MTRQRGNVSPSFAGSLLGVCLLIAPVAAYAGDWGRVATCIAFGAAALLWIGCRSE